jgi:hypothetical protein
MAALPLVALLALGVVPGCFGRGTAERQERARRAVLAENWALVPPDDRLALARAVDDAWRRLTTYRMRYRNGLPQDLQAGRAEWEATSQYQLRGGRILAQEDTAFISAASPGSGGREERLQGYRIRTRQPYTNRRGQRTVTELIYRRSLPGPWVCERVPADRDLPAAPALDLIQAGDAGFAEFDGIRARGFILPEGAFGLRSEAIVWIEVETLRVVRQEIPVSRQGRAEVWTFEGFDQPRAITPPKDVPCHEV